MTKDRWARHRLLERHTFKMACLVALPIVPVSMVIRAVGVDDWLMAMLPSITGWIDGVFTLCVSLIVLPFSMPLAIRFIERRYGDEARGGEE